METPPDLQSKKKLLIYNKSQKNEWDIVYNKLYTNITFLFLFFVDLDISISSFGFSEAIAYINQKENGLLLRV